MDLIPGKNVRLKHFAGKYCNKGEILESAGAILTIKPEKSFTVFSFFEEDPLVLIYEQDDKYFVSQCTIISIDYINSCFSILVENSEEFNNRRKDERFPTSLYGVVANSLNKETIFINNVSEGGINLKTKLNAEINDKIEIEATLDGTYVYISGCIKWKKEQNKFYEYGIFSEEATPELSSLIENIKREHFLTIRNLKYENALLDNV